MRTPQTHASRRQRVTCTPGLERLESLRLMTGGVVSGHVFLDANGNGVFDAGEAPVAGTTVEMRNASGVVVGSETTDASGAYAFRRDRTANTAPTTLTRTVTLAEAMTNFEQGVNLPQFDPSLGTLSAVEVRLVGRVTSDIRSENLGGISEATIEANATGVVGLTGPGLNLSIPLDVLAGSFQAGTYDGTMDFDGSSGHDFGPVSASGSRSATLTDPAAWAPFVGTGTVAASVSASAQAFAQGGANLATWASSFASAEVSVTYHYTPSDALTPGNYTVAQVNPPAGTVVAKPMIPVALASSGTVDVDIPDIVVPTPINGPSISAPVNIPQAGPIRIVSATWSAPKAKPATLVLTLAGNVDPGRASNPASYAIQGVGQAARRAGVRLAIVSASYDASTKTVNLRTNLPLNPALAYTLTARNLAPPPSVSNQPLSVVLNQGNQRLDSPSVVATQSAQPGLPTMPKWRNTPARRRWS